MTSEILLILMSLMKTKSWGLFFKNVSLCMQKVFLSQKIWVICHSNGKNEHKRYVQRYLTIFPIFCNTIIPLVEKVCLNLLSFLAVLYASSNYQIHMIESYATIVNSF